MRNCHLHLALLALLGIAHITSATPAGEKCPAYCVSDLMCCEAGGCYGGACIDCRPNGFNCLTDRHCCQAGGCYATKCIQCRDWGFVCQNHSQCCPGHWCGPLGRCEYVFQP
ncbi:uncharacterized protein LOC110850083 [Folsomia candida]|uniref:uncharacterized protein LOC110850083 n=1 Tax=Folsomia candida TaxID=158441 RepID=UPI000B8F1A52|nr:uncharacterized protein LOC110850083 [Folsomia candida]